MNTDNKQEQGLEVYSNAFSLKQDIVIDSLLCTHRELCPVDLVDYKINRMMAGGIVLTIHSGEYWYSYKILKTGFISETRKSNNNISFHKLEYFS